MTPRSRVGRLTLALVACCAFGPGCPGEDVADDDTAMTDDDVADDDDTTTSDDIDADGDGWTISNGDCDDENDAVHPGADEVCNGEDDDCDEVVPADESDADGDGYRICDGDCDDDDDEASPGAVEVCNGVDDDCDEGIDEGFDLDGDGFTVCGEDGELGTDDDDCNDDEATLTPTDADADSYSSCDGDCDDGDDAVYPGADEACNGIDDDCDSVVPTDEADLDGDGYLACEECDDTDPGLDLADLDGDGYSTCAGDCDDGDPEQNPSDADGDGVASCDGDCDDSDATLNLQDVDADGSSTCDGDCDDGDATLNLQDSDGDGSTTCDGDCDDGDAGRHPGATEACNGEDDDCDGVAAADETDADADGIMLCAGDCDDADPSVHPGATEVCNGGIDDDCDATTDEWVDADGDGVSACGGDCDDTDASLNLDDQDGDGWDTCAGDCDDGDTSLGLDDLDLDGFDTCDGDCQDDWLAWFDDVLFTTFPASESIDLGPYHHDEYWFIYDVDLDIQSLVADVEVSLDSAILLADSATIDHSTDVAIDTFELAMVFDDGAFPWEIYCEIGVTPFELDVTHQLDFQIVEPGGGVPPYLDVVSQSSTVDLQTPLEQQVTYSLTCDDLPEMFELYLVPTLPGLVIEATQGLADYLEGDLLDSTALSLQELFELSGEIHSNASEICDGVDNDCDGLTDEGYDQDADGYTTCGELTGEVDCDDTDSGIFPGALEICDGVDNDCDGEINEEDADGYEMWETSDTSPGHDLSGVSPALVLGGGPCSFTVVVIFYPVTLDVVPGSTTLASGFHSPDDLWDIYEFETTLTSNIVEWAMFLVGGQTLPAACTEGEVSFTATQPIQVTVWVEDTPYVDSGTSGTVSFQLSQWELFDTDYRVVVEPLSGWVGCIDEYTLTFDIP